MIKKKGRNICTITLLTITAISFDGLELSIIDILYREQKDKCNLVEEDRINQDGRHRLGDFLQIQPGGQLPFPGGGPVSITTTMGPPPSFTPATPMAQAYTGGMNMNRCLFRNTYVWMRNGNSFWFFPTAVTRNIIFGFRWSRRNGWIPRSIQRDNIMTFSCSFF